MNAVIESLKSRRSCRKYLDKQISDAELNTILETATWTPTGQGKQSPCMVVVQDPETIAQISKLNAAVMGVDTDPFYGAPTVVIVFADNTRVTYVEDGALVMGTLMNAAHAVGVASCWIHRARQVFKTEEGLALMRKWGIPENYEGIGNCILGYAAEGGFREPLPRKEDYIVRT